MQPGCSYKAQPPGLTDVLYVLFFILVEKINKKKTMTT